MPQHYFMLFKGDRLCFAAWADDLPGNHNIKSDAQAALDSGHPINFKAIAQKFGTTDYELG